jgi:hypothetical protein
VTNNICKWKAVFKLVPERIGVSQVKDLPDVKLLTDVIGNNRYITSIEITTPDSSFVDAINYSKLIANRCVDMISYIVGFGVSCSLSQINEIGPPGTVKTGAVFCTIDAVLSKMQNVDITTTSFSNALQNRDRKLVRQLSHYRLGLLSSDIVEKIREFYQVLEDEYTKNHPSIEKYKYVRHLVSHPELTKSRSKEEAEKIVGKSYFDPSAPEDICALERHLEEIKNNAEQLIKSKIQSCDAL